MKYVLVYLIKGKVEKYHQNLVKNVGPKFNENYLIENPLPSHITLKSPFETKNIKNLEKALLRFSKMHKTSKMQVNGFGNFRKSVIFLKINFSKQSEQIQKDLLNVVKDIKDIGLRDFDKSYKPHATIAYGNNLKKFEQMWGYINTLNKPLFDLSFDNVSILKKPRKYWRIHKIYKLL